MKRLIIVGAGGFGREVLSWVLQSQAHQREWCVSGFLDANPKALDGYDDSFPILGSPTDYQPSGDEVFVCAMGEPKTRLNVCRHLEAYGACFATLIHPSAVVGRNTTMGRGCILCPGAVLTADVRIGHHVIINACASVGHDAVIGDGCTLSGHADVTGFARLGSGVFLGTHAAVLPSARVGDFSVVGAGSVVLRDVKPGATVMGVPAIQVSGFTPLEKHQGA
jgi:sugar O-acyltransferase (sialic acid O-acetyltransferase NeuD family)